VQDAKSQSIGYRLDRGLERSAEEKNYVVGSKKRILLTIIKSVVSVLLIWWVLQGTSFTEIFTAIRSAHIALLVFAFSLHFLIYYVSAHRWRVLLKFQGINTSIRFLIGSWMVCVFFNNLLPSLIGGDIIRAYDSWRLGTGKTGAVAVIFIDRLMGMLALTLFAFAALLLSKKMTAHLPFLSFWVQLGIIVMFMGICTIIMFSQRIAKFIAKIRLPFTPKLQESLRKIVNQFQALGRWRCALPITLGLSLVLHTSNIAHFYIIARALDLAIPVHTFFLIIPLAIFAMMIPASINGIGIRENVFVFFFCSLGVSKPEAVAFAWLTYGILVCHGVLGGIIYALRR
jgi:uncharacterized protein (TIRG00374 family)